MGALGPIWGGALALEAEGRLKGCLGAEPPGVWSLLALGLQIAARVP